MKPSSDGLKLKIKLGGEKDKSEKDKIEKGSDKDKSDKVGKEKTQAPKSDFLSNIDKATLNDTKKRASTVKRPPSKFRSTGL